MQPSSSKRRSSAVSTSSALSTLPKCAWAAKPKFKAFFLGRQGIQVLAPKSQPRDGHTPSRSAAKTRLTKADRHRTVKFGSESCLGKSSDMTDVRRSGKALTSTSFELIMNGSRSDYPAVTSFCICWQKQRAVDALPCTSHTYLADSAFDNHWKEMNKSHARNQTRETPQP